MPSNPNPIIGASFWEDKGADKKTVIMYQHVADEHTVVGPRLATKADTEANSAVWAKFTADASKEAAKAIKAIEA